MAIDIANVIGKLTSLGDSEQSTADKNVISSGDERQRIVYEATIFWETYSKLKHTWEKDVKGATSIREKEKSSEEKCRDTLCTKVTDEVKTEFKEDKEEMAKWKKWLIGGILTGGAIKGILQAFSTGDEKADAEVGELMKTDPEGAAKKFNQQQLMKKFANFQSPEEKGGSGGSGGSGGAGIQTLIPESKPPTVSETAKKVAGMSRGNMLQDTVQAIGVSNRYLAEISAGIRSIAKGTGGGNGTGLGSGPGSSSSPVASNTYKDNPAARGPSPGMKSSRSSYFDSAYSMNVPGILS